MASSSSACGEVMKLPPFDRSSISRWFERVELLFRIKKIENDLVKFGSVVQALDPASMAIARKYLVDWDKYPNTYQFLKTDLLNHAGKSKMEKIQVILN